MMDSYKLARCVLRKIKNSGFQISIAALGVAMYIRNCFLLHCSFLTSVCFLYSMKNVITQAAVPVITQAAVPVITQTAVPVISRTAVSIHLSFLSYMRQIDCQDAAMHGVVL